MALIPVPGVKLNDHAVVFIMEADERCRAKIDQTVDFVVAELMACGCLKGPGSETLRKERVRNAFLEAYEGRIEEPRMEAAKARFEEMNPPAEPRSDLNATDGPWSGGFAENH